MASPPRKSPALRWRWLLPVVVLVLAFHVLPFGSPALDRAFFDSASRHPLRPPPLPANSALVLIDDQTMDVVGREPYAWRWPFPRLAFAGLIAALNRAGAEKIVMDITFYDQGESAEQDMVLAAVAAAAGNVLLAEGKTQKLVLWDGKFRQEHPSFFTHPRTGQVDFPADEDGVARSFVVPGSLAAAAVFPSPGSAGGMLRWHGGLKQIESRGVPTVPAAHFLIAGQEILRHLGEKVPDFSPEALAPALVAEPPMTGPAAALVRGRVVFVGSNARNTFDLKPMSVGRLEPGVLIHWTAWTNLTAGGFITALPRWSSLLAGALAAAVVLVVSGRWPGLMAPTCFSLGLAALFLVAAYAGLSSGWFFPPASPLLAIGLTLLGVVTENFWSEQRRKREIQTMFGAYVDPGVVAQLVRNPDSIQLGGELREATVFFSDLVGFTELSEKLRDRPEQMVEVVNAYLEETSECLHLHGAYVDKYIGDAVMAVFGVPGELPDHALAACHAALAACRALDGVNDRYAAAVGVRLAVRIGLNSGHMIVGNLGSSRKKNYTVMGDAVNLASRLEGANKEFGTHILLGETTARAVAGRMATRPLTRLQVKGKQEAIEVHELMGVPESLSPGEREFLAAYLPGYAQFSARQFAGAAADFRRALAARPDDAVTRELLQQAVAFAQEPPPAGWEPILTLKSK